MLAIGFFVLSIRAKITTLLVAGATIPVIVVTQGIVGLARESALNNLKDTLKTNLTILDKSIDSETRQLDAGASILAQSVTATGINLDDAATTSAQQPKLTSFIQAAKDLKPNASFYLITNSKGQVIARSIQTVRDDFSKYPALPGDTMAPAQFTPVTSQAEIELGGLGIIQLSTNHLAPAIAATPSPTEFDLLEMDRYSDLHLVSQGQIETIVQLQEVTADIELSLREMIQSVSSLNQTTRTMQSNLTQTQMLPFADVVKRFPRLIRDLSIQFDKSFTLKIGGENTGIDRSMLESLSDPPIHLLRNAFDRGIENPATRLAAGKPAQGTISIEASQRGGETVITIADDGGGIRLDRIRQRLEQMGLPSEEVAQMPETDLLDTIFEPGFSASTSLTELVWTRRGDGCRADEYRANSRHGSG